MTPIAATAHVPAAPEEVFAFLADWRNHWELAGGRIELLELQDGARPRGVVSIRGPLGLRRRARTRLTGRHEPAFLGGVAEIGARTRAHVSWNLSPAGAGRTRVVLAAAVSSLHPLDRLLLLAGGRLWMRRLFASTLRLLDERLTPPGGSAAARPPRSTRAAEPRSPATRSG